MATVNGESVFLTILSKLWSVFSLMAFLNSFISFLISLRRRKETQKRRGLRGEPSWIPRQLTFLLFLIKSAKDVKGRLGP